MFKTQNSQPKLPLCGARGCVAFVVLIAGMSSASQAAQSVTPNDPPLVKAPPIALSQHRVSDGDAYAYRPWFENGAWQGDLVEYTIDSGGGIATDVDLSTSPPSSGGNNWSARLELDAVDWDTGRRIITMGDGEGVAFRWDSLPGRLKNAIDTLACNPVSMNPVRCDSGSESSDLLSFIRGQRDKEGASGFRRRYSRFGDIINSTPVFVGVPDSGFDLPGYDSFRSSKSERQGRVYVGANDGMLHAIDAANGREVFAYIPSMLAGDLRKLAARPYKHTYFVDGRLSVGDANFGSSGAPDWRTVLVGGLGAGGKGVFAIDVTRPGAISEDVAADKLLWELNGEDDADLGYAYSKPRITRVGGRWYAVFGNGYGSSSGAAKLYLVDLATGSVTKMNTRKFNRNGLSTPILVNADDEFGADFAYAGDLNGTLWRFDLNNRGAAATEIISIKAGQFAERIIGSPDVSAHPSGVGYMVYFATGGVLAEADLEDGITQSVYGVWDDFEVNDGAKGKKLEESALTTTTYPSGGTNRNIRLSDAEAFDPSRKAKGWRVDLPNGERVPGDVVIRNKTVQLISTKRTAGVEGEPPRFTNWLYKLDYLTGGAPRAANFDLNGDSLLNGDDFANYGPNDNGDAPDRANNPVALQIEDGLVSQRAISSTASGLDVAYTNNIVPGVPPSCTGTCKGGVQGGHFDVDTDKTYGGSTDGHIHEYDEKFNTTIINYLKIFGGGTLDKLDNPPLSLGKTKKFILVIANADLSPAGQITLGAKTWNVVDYQKMVQKNLEGVSGDITGDGLYDYDGKSLLFDINTLRSTSFELTFTDRAILDGGLIPTQTGCVIGEPSITNDRWRNGALTIQLIPADNVHVVAQYPSDLATSVQSPDKVIVLKEDTDGDGTIDREYGGLRARDNGSFIYESTVFWHYDGVCYGEEDYENDVAREIQEAVDKLIEEERKFQEEIEKEIGKLERNLEKQRKKVEKERDNPNKYQEEKRKLDEIQAELDNLRAQVSSGSGSGVGSTGGGTPVVIEGTVNRRLGLGFSRKRIMWHELR